MTAGGIGRRIGGDIPKQFLPLLQIPILDRTLALFQNHSSVDDILLTLPSRWINTHAAPLRERYPKLANIVAGGDDRQASVYTALGEPAPPGSLVCIHDGVRPLFNPVMLDDLLAAAVSDGAAACAVPVTDTIAESTDTGRLIRHLDRHRLRALQTPQVFRLDLIRNAHAAAREAGEHYTDDTALAAAAGHSVRLLPGDPANIKITSQADLKIAEELLMARKDQE